MQSNLQTLLHTEEDGTFPAERLHVAIIPDGNGRWAQARGLVRSAGHRAGMDAMSRVVAAAPELGIGTLTAFAFSAVNWQRPKAEVTHLLCLLHEYLLSYTAELEAAGVRLSFLGRRDRLSHSLREAMEAAETATAGGETLHLRIAFDYSAREALFRAACRFYKVTEVSCDTFARVLGEVNADGAPDVDLLVRTGGDQRLSDFLLWESAYAELYFTPKFWPEFTAEDLAAAVEEFRARDRRFGRVVDAAAS